MLSTRYTTSAFLGYATAAIMADAFLDVCRGVDLNRMLQLLKYVMTRNLACLDQFDDLHQVKLWHVTKKLLILSRGQATVERGFSINKHIVVENLREVSVVSQRVVYDAIATAGGLCDVPITKSMLSYAQGVRQRLHGIPGS